MLQDPRKTARSSGLGEANASYYVQYSIFALPLCSYAAQAASFDQRACGSCTPDCLRNVRVISLSTNPHLLHRTRTWLLPFYSLFQPRNLKHPTLLETTPPYRADLIASKTSRSLTTIGRGFQNKVLTFLRTLPLRTFVSVRRIYHK